MSETMMSVAQGFLQGLTEYLPVSSSAHLAIFQNLFGVAEAGLAFDLLLHLATLLATMLYFARDILQLLCEFFSSFKLPDEEKREGWYFGWAVIFGSVPTAVLGVLLEPLVERAAVSTTWIGINLIITGVLLFLIGSPRIMGNLCVKSREVCISVGLIVGFAQGLAVFPGISRSGATIAAALLCGLSTAEAFRFSFLLSLPAIGGAALLELCKADALSALPSGAFWAALCAFVSGFAALALMHKTVISGRWKFFSFYCCLLGLTTIFVL